MRRWVHFMYRGERWNVCLASDRELRKYQGYHGPKPLWGSTGFEDRKIVILKTLERRDRISTLLHELLHVIDEERKLHMTHKAVYALESDLAALVMREDGWDALWTT